MIELYKPKIEDLWFRKELLKDEDTMSFNYAYGGTIDFSESKWLAWYNKWLISNDMFYRYLLDTSANKFVGEVAYYLDNNHYIISIIVFAKYRNQGFGKNGLDLLCKVAKENGIDYLYDDIAIDNPNINLFLKNGFIEDYRTNNIIMIKKKL